MRSLLGLLGALSLLVPLPPTAAAQDATARAVFFYSPTCPHCHEVMNNHLPPLRQRYGERFQVVGVDVSSFGGQELYQATVAHFRIPEERLGVPTLVIGTEVLVGSQEIPQRLPGLIESALAAGGVDWPAVPAVRQALAAQGLLAPAAPAARADTPSAAPRPGQSPSGPGAERTPAASPGPTVAASPDTAGPGAPRTAGEPEPGPVPPAGFDAHLAPDSGTVETPGPVAARFLRDPVGNTIAVATLLALLGTLLWSAGVVLRPGARAPVHPGWIFPTLSLAGMGVAAYLSFVEVTGAEAVCGPVGDCNAVQQSPWALLFGVVPVGVLGLAGYVALLGAWLFATRGPRAQRPRGWLVAWGTAWVGVAFSAYLTFLEPFVIGATCAWCITSALIMAGLLAGATGGVTEAGSDA